MLEAWNARRMQLGDLVVTHILHAETGVITMSALAGAEVQLRLSADVGEGPVEIGSAKLGIGWTFQTKMEFVVLSPSGIVPAYRASVLTEDGNILKQTRVVKPYYLMPPGRPVAIAEDDNAAVVAEDDYETIDVAEVRPMVLRLPST